MQPEDSSKFRQNPPLILVLSHINPLIISKYFNANFKIILQPTTMSSIAFFFHVSSFHTRPRTDLSSHPYLCVCVCVYVCVKIERYTNR